MKRGNISGLVVTNSKAKKSATCYSGSYIDLKCQLVVGVLILGVFKSQVRLLLVQSLSWPDEGTDKSYCEDESELSHAHLIFFCKT